MISSSLGVDDHGLAGPELLVEELLRQRILDEALDRAAERPSAERLVVAPEREQRARRVGQLDVDVLRLSAAPSTRFIIRLTICFTSSCVSVVEDDHLVDTVEELRAELPLQLLHHVAPSSGRRSRPPGLLEREPDAADPLSRCPALPRFDVMMMIVFLKSTCGPASRSGARPPGSAAAC